jgi:type 1 glutamine amidotransferase
MPRGLALVLLAMATVVAAPAAGKTRVLLVTGGHDFETNQFFQIFQDNPAITFVKVNHPDAHAWLKPDKAREWDVLVCYDMWADITEEAKADFVSRLQEGKGLVVLHHAIADYSKWPEYANIIGAKYYLEKQVVNGVEKARSVYEHGVKFKVQIADPAHPVTRGLQDFEVHDETYNLFDVQPSNHALLKTAEPKSAPVIGWSKEYGKARVVYLQLGHDHFAYENPNYRRLIAQAIMWVARRD